MIFVADTNAVIWAQLNERRRLGKRARAAFEAADRGRALIYISTVTVLELDWLDVRRRLHYVLGLDDLVRRLSTAPGYAFAPLTSEIILRSRKFRNLESMDRLIVATAEELDCPLITSDAAIQDMKPVPIVWG